MTAWFDRTPVNPEEHKSHRKLYGRRKGPKLSPHQERLLETLLPQLALTLEAGRDPKRYFATPSTTSGSRSVSARASICYGRRRIIRTSG